MRHEVLQDHLLQVAVALRAAQPALRAPRPAPPRSRRSRPGSRSVNGIFSSPAASIVASRAAGCLVGDPAWTVSISRSAVDSSIRPWRGGDLSQPGQVVLAQDAEVRVRQHPPLQRPFAGPDGVGGEVLVAPLGQPAATSRVDLGPLAGQDQELLGVPFQRLVEQRLDLLRRVDVRLVRREGAVLAVALAGTREGERVVAGEGDPSHPPKLLQPPGRPGPAVGSSDQGAGSVGLFGSARFLIGGRIRSGASVGGRPPGSSTNL